MQKQFMKGRISEMYQKEWDRLEKGLLKGLNGYVDRAQ